MASIRRPSGVTFLTIVALLALAVPGLSQGGQRTPAMAAPQTWSGGAGIGVEVRDRDGRPIEGAQVQLAFAAGDEEAGGPAEVRTDGAGRAAVRGLAPGEWVLTVRHPETMAYVATLQVRAGRRPREVAASQVKVGKSLRSLRLKYFEVSGPAERPAPSMPRVEREPRERSEPAKPEPQRPPRVEPPSAPPSRSEPAPETAAEPPAQAPAQPPVQPPAQPPAQPPVQPPAQPPAQPPVQPSETVEPSGPAAEMPQEASAEETPAEMAAEPASEAAPVQEPAPAPVPQAAPPTPAPVEPPEEAAPQPAARRSPLRSFDTGSCPECMPGEWSVTGEGAAAGGDGVCPENLEARIDRAAALLGSSRALGPWTGSIELAGGAVSVLGNQAYGELTTLLRPVLADDASCRVLAVLLPAGATFVGFEMGAADGGSWTQCLPGKACAGGGGWIGDPLLVRTPAGLVVAGAYGNAGAEPRRVRLTVYFTAPEGWEPR